MQHENSPYAPPATDIYAPPAADISVPHAAEAQYFTVGALKFTLMSITTFGLYPIYWFYRNWKLIRDRHELSIWPFWRAVFAPLWTFSMGRIMVDEGKERGIALDLSYSLLGVLYLLMNVMTRLPDPWWLISILSFVPLLPFDSTARLLNGNGTLAPPNYGRLTVWNIAWIVLGTLFLLLVFLGLMVPMEEL